MPVWTIQSNLNRGQLDPRLIGRVDLDSYYNGVREATNTRTTPQGGMEKRPGQLFVDTTEINARLENFSFSSEQQFLLVFTANSLKIYKDNVLQDTVGTTISTADQLRDFDYIQSADTGIVVHPDLEPLQIVRNSDTNWTVFTAPLLNIPQFDYNDASSPTPVSEIQNMAFANFTTGDRFTLSLEGAITDEITYSEVLGVVQTDTINEIVKQLTNLPNTPSTGISGIQGAGTSVDITFANAAAKDWDNMIPTITFDNSGSDNAITVTETQKGSARAEDVWSNTRGWPVTCSFHEGRLYFGGSKSRPATLWGSVVNDFFNFDKGTALDDQGVEATLDTDQVNAIQATYSNRSLQIFTSGQEFYIRDSPVTPSNIAVIPQSNLGSKRIRPVTLDGVTVYIQRSGRSVNQFVFINEIQSNQANSITTAIPELIDNPRKLAVFRGSINTDANYIYILNTNGELTVFNTLNIENVRGFTRWTIFGQGSQPQSTLNKLESIAVVDDKLYMVASRQVGGSTVYYIEQEDPDLFVDSAVKQASGTTITGLSHLNGETVEAVSGTSDDGYTFLGEFEVSGGQIEIPSGFENIQAGLGWRPTIQTMPLNVDLGAGPNQYQRKKIQRIGLQIFETLGTIVNGVRFPQSKETGVNQFDPAVPITGQFRKYVLGYSLDASVTITQEEPLPMTILSIGIEVAT